MNSEKTLLREKMKRLRNSYADFVGGEDALLKNFISNGLDKYRSYFIYRSFSSEAGTGKLTEYLIREGKELFFPIVREKEMFAVGYTGKFKEGCFGIEEPEGEIYSGNIDVAIIPLLAVDGRGYRIGYGGGYYDRFLKGRNCLKIAYCFDFQVLDEVPREGFDVRADAVLTDKRFIRSNDEN